MTTHPKKLIEVALPLPEINDASAYDKMPGIGPHPKGIHQWWSRKPLPTARAILFASVVDDPSAYPNRFPSDGAQNSERERLLDIVRELMQKKLHDHPEVYAKACAEMLKHTDGRLPPVMDPFSGGGSIPLEAARLGFDALAADLNPVAVLLNKCNLELVPNWIDRQPVNPKVRENVLRKTGWRGVGGIAEDVRYYGRIIQKRATEKIGHLYPKVRLSKQYGGREANVIAWIWARTVASPNPAAKGAHVPLLSKYWLSSKKGSLAWVEPIVDRNNETWRFEVRTGEPSDRGFVKRGTQIGRGGFECLLTKTPITFGYLRAEGAAGRLSERLIAVVAELPRGRTYLSVSTEHEKIAKTERRDSEIEALLPNEALGFRVQNYGIRKYSQMFTSRQLTAILTLSDSIKEIRQDVTKNAEEAGLSASEAKDYAKTVATFLALALNRCADFNNALCTWNPGNQKVMHLFGRQAIPMSWDFAEANIMGNSVGSWSTCSNYVADCIEVIGKSAGKKGKARQIDAASPWNDIKGLMVSTDPPYYDNIGYAPLSDFFYIWLRRSIGDLHPELFKTILAPKEPELTAAPERFGGSKEKAKDHFESGFKKSFTALREKMDPRFPLTVYYAFKQEDEQVGSDEGDDGDEKTPRNGVDRTTGWETLLDALLGSGFQITATWPIRSEQQWRMRSMGSNALASCIVLACRPRPVDTMQCTRRDFMNGLKKELPAALKHLQQGNIAPVDLAQAAIGPGMAIFSRYAKVMESSGRSMTVRTALNLINQALDEVLAEQEAEFDGDTRWALAWFDQHGVDEGDFGVAETLSRAKNTAVNGLVQAGIVSARGGKVRLVKRDELPEDWDPSSDKRLTVWEATQHLIHALDQHGESGAADLLRKLGGAVGEMARELSYRLHKVCEKKNWSSEALAYNSLVLAWPELTRLAQAGPQYRDQDMFNQE